MYDILSFAKLIGKSKKVKRAGWVRESIGNPESVAEHCFRLSVLAMVLADRLGVDQNKLIKMAIIHDLGETKTGDMVVERGTNIDYEMKKKKEDAERKIIQETFSVFGNEYKEIFQEMIERKTNEAKIFWQLDKLEMAIQALEYEKEQKKNLEEFFVNAKIHITHPIISEILTAVLQERRT